MVECSRVKYRYVEPWWSVVSQVEPSRAMVECSRVREG